MRITRDFLSTMTGTIIPQIKTEFTKFIDYFACKVMKKLAKNYFEVRKDEELDLK
jgi:hypothetical protein